MIILQMDTEHFEFVAAGNDDQQANETLENMLRFHGEQYALADRWWIGHYEIERREYVAGEGHRDGQLLYRGATNPSTN